MGKIFYEHSLIEDQTYFLQQIQKELEKERNNGTPYDALVVSGDIYDRAVPPPDAVTLFSSFLYNVHTEFPELEMFFISGNHDSPDRLSFASELLLYEKVHICTDVKKIAEPVIVGKGDEKAAVYQIPFLTPGVLPAEKTDEILRSQQDLTAKALSIIKEAHKKNYAELPSVISAHLFTCGASVSEAERSYVGTAEQVDSAVFDGISYTALGHIHKAQSFCGGKVQYAGAPLAYSFGENADKCMLRVAVSGSNVNTGKIPVEPLHPVVRLTGTFDEFYKEASLGLVPQKLKNSYIEIECTDTFVHENAMQQLSAGYPDLLSFTRKSSTADAGASALTERKKVLSGANKDDGAIFDLFMKDVYGSVLDNAADNEKSLYKKEKALFTQLAKELQ